MCGIAGFLLFHEAADSDLVRRMCDQIEHRGPDDFGFHVDRGCGIGMRRLSIIDLAGGHQPIPNEDRSQWIVYNGEVYNFQATRERLIAQGHVFATRSDTEVILHLHEQDGLNAVHELRGMFAYAIWNARKQELLLVRDRLGKKPVYYAHTPQGFYFASEIKALWPAGVPSDIDPEAIRLYLQFGHVPDPLSAYRSIRKLPPGSWIKVDAQGRVEQGTYWRVPPPTDSENVGFTRKEACEQLREAFDESVRLRMIADVPLGAFLSGGIDSSLVVASMARQSNQPVKTFSVGFDEPGFFNELPYAKLVADQYKTEHHELIVKPDAIELVDRLVHFLDEPFADASSIPTFIVSEFAARHVKVVLSGDGGDEFFGGYHSFFDADKRQAWDHYPSWLRSIASAAGDVLPYRAYGKNFLRAFSRQTSIERYIESISLNSYYLRRRVLQPEWQTPSDADFLRKTFGYSVLETGSSLSQGIHFESTTKLTGDILVKVDRMSMANSLEVRSPMLDYKWIELANRIPNAWKTQNGQGKLILLDALADRLPPELLKRPKKGFGIPLDLWFRGALKPMLWDRLKSRRFLEFGFANATAVDEMLAEHDSGRRDNSDFLWLLLILDLWMQHQTSASARPAATVSK
jgi:asparagine synthase (glutamine-hydrolysing)